MLNLLANLVDGIIVLTRILLRVPYMKNKENKGKDESVEEILRSSMADLAEKNKKAYDLLIKKAGEGFFEQHQTRGAFEKLANQLLNMSKECETENES